MKETFDFPSLRLDKSIALRTALMSWIITMTTMIIFVLVTLPRQKEAFLDNLKSKANGVAASMHEVAAGAAVSEDYASVVSAAQAILAGDPELDFLIIMKNNGFSLIMEQTGWKVEPSADAYWLPAQRISAGGIKTVPLFNRRIFHYAQPFDYMGIQWGWIHVGHSLEGYDQSVQTLNKSTGLLAIGCLIISLLISITYAALLVRPVLTLRRVVEQLAGGNFTVRAETNRQDELGSLAKSINTMADALLKRDRILESVRFAAQNFMRSLQWQDTIDPVLAKIGQSADVGQVTIFLNQVNDAGRLYGNPEYKWTAKGLHPRILDPGSPQLPYGDLWNESFSQNQIISGPVSGMSGDIRSFFESRDVRSIIAIPVFVDKTWWGLMLLEDLVRERFWSDAEKDSLSAGADILGASIARQRVRDALLEAKETLEQRVKERTRELQDQFIAKEQALTKLAEAQSSIVEMSRAAGMAEVATGVLHNVGNVLNSVNVSCNLILNQVRESRTGNVARVAGLIARSGDDLARFLTRDPKGCRIPSYLASLSAVLAEEQQLILKETESLQQRIDHIKEIVTMQQTYGRVSGFLETIAPEQLMEDSVTFNAAALARHDITIHRRYSEVPLITVDRHKVIQILLNLITNAKYACEGTGQGKIITLRIFATSDQFLYMQVSDNGMGIAPENLTRIFQHGFTTRDTGHGFGLHSGAIAAKALGGNLTVHSDGPGLGATFTLELPVYQEKLPNVQ